MLTGAMAQLLRTFEDWSHRSYKDALGSCKAIALASLARGNEQRQRLQHAKSAFRLFQLAQWLASYQKNRHGGWPCP